MPNKKEEWLQDIQYRLSKCTKNLQGIKAELANGNKVSGKGIIDSNNLALNKPTAQSSIHIDLQANYQLSENGRSYNLKIRPNSGYENPLYNYFRSNKKHKIHKWHHYFDIYHNHFSKFRGTSVRVLEIGVSAGGSLQMWKSYFGKQAQIFGVDIQQKCKELEEEQIQIFIGDTSDRNFLRYLKQILQSVDIVIDDGGHKMQQQLAAYEELYPIVSEQGIYLVEDLHTSYWKKYGGGYKRKGTFVEYAKNFIDEIHAWHSQELQPTFLTKSATGVHFYDSVLVIEKYPNPQKPKVSKTGFDPFKEN